MVKKILTWTGIILLVVIIFAIAAPFIFKDKIIAKVKEEANNSLNAKVDFGAFDLTLISSFPDFTFSINDVSVSGINEFEGDTLLSLKNLTLSLNLMSVIKGEQYQIRSISLDHANILAKVLKDGKANWDITKSSSPSQPEQPASSSSSTFKMSLKKLEIKDSKIIYDDAQMGFYTALEGFNHTLSGDFTQDLFTLQTLTAIEKFTMNYGSVSYLNKVKTAIKADLEADMPKFKFTFKENEIALNELVLGIDGYFAMPGNDMDMDIKYNARKTEFKNILSLIPAVYAKDFASVKTSGNLALDGYVKGIYNDKKMPAFGLKLLIDNAMFQYPSLPKSVNNIAIDIKVDNPTGIPDNTVIDVNKFHVEMAGNPVDIRMHVETPVSDASIKGEILGKIDLTSVKDVVPLDKEDNLDGKITADIKLNGRMSSIEKKEYEKFNAQGQLTINDMNYKSKTLTYPVALKSMTLKFSPQFVELANFDSKIGRSDIQADGKIENFLQYVFKNQLLKGVFNMHSSMMDLNEFMTGSGQEQTTQEPAKKDTSAMSVVEVPANIDFVMTTKINKLLYDNIEIKEVDGEIEIKDQKVDMTNLKMKLMQGAMTMSGSYDTKNIKKPAINFTLDISDFDIPQTFKTFVTVQKLAPIAKYATGKFSTDLKLAGVLDAKMMPVLPSLTGGGRLKTQQVSVNGFEPLNKLADAVKMEKFKRADFNDLNLTYHFENGRVKVDPFDFKMGNIAGKMQGSNGFDQSIDYTMDLEIPSAALGSTANAAIGGLLAKAGGLTGTNVKMPEKINLAALFGGTATNPTVKVNFKNAAGNVKDALKDQAKELIDAKKKELEDKAKQEVDKAKQEAERRLNEEKAKAEAEAERLRKEAEDKAKAEAERLKKEAENKAKDKLKGLFGPK